MPSSKKCLSSELFTCRRILFIMVTSGFIINAIIKTIFNITIVAMVKNDGPHNQTEHFDWDESQKQNILGIFFWGFALTKIPSGTLAEMVGSRVVSGHSMTLAGILTVLTPAIARLNYFALLASRVLMGFLIGASWPALMPLVSKWIAPTEQSVFLSCIASTAIGYALSSSLGGLLISEFGWPSVFYVFGGVTILWSLIWFYFIYDCPQKHPRISSKEKEEIENKLAKCDSTRRKIKITEIPWKKIITSGPVWGIAIAQVSSFMGNMTIPTELPSYLDQVLHYNIRDNGVLSSLPCWGVYVASLSFGYIADRLLVSNKLSVTGVRKLFGCVSLLFPSIFLIILSFWGDNAVIALTAFCLVLIFNAAVTAGHCPNILDISPNFSGTICGLVNMLSAFAVYFATKLVAVLLRNGHTYQDWQPLFWILCGTYGSGGIIYFFLCSAKIQSWDSPKSDNIKSKDWEEAQALDVKNV